MISPILQALDPFFRFALAILYIPWTIWETMRDAVRTTISLNGYTAINPDGVLDVKETKQDENKQDEGEEGETKE